METNVGIPDRIIRVLFSTAIIALYLKGRIRGIAGLLLILSGALMSSVMSGYCPLYKTLKINTNK